MKKLFISQPMKDKTDEEIIAVRKKAIQAAKEVVGSDVEVLDSFFLMMLSLFGSLVSHSRFCPRQM